ncbi:hypothetical protein LRP50_08415 [Enterovibrio sp. ZSDZ42]|uniref:YcaO domain-containing protein n=1 Tax=Enterovibrio gelatinilyticus TaxID=2899819 RepID=A0ABT5QYP6_9GAMM|nr:hypothetical protein [Enterovibrio sp. ZSDZ42]MDD1793146.1 hypothetical protein [Enterovibrio sp. ZSDZ42]
MQKFNQFAETIKRLDCLKPECVHNSALLLGESGKLSCYYSPFEYVNKNAKVVICGMTPGAQQSQIALLEAQQRLFNGEDFESIFKGTKETASFAGAMRKNLVKMLDAVGLQTWLDVKSCEALFSSLKGQVHYTSALRYPVFNDGKNYSGTPSMTTHPFLREMLDTTLSDELSQLASDAIYIPLGGQVESALLYLADKGVINRERILTGLPHLRAQMRNESPIFVVIRPGKPFQLKLTQTTLIRVNRRYFNKLASFNSTVSSRSLVSCCSVLSLFYSNASNDC